MSNVQSRTNYSGHYIGSPCQGSEYHRVGLCPRTAFLHSLSPPLTQLLAAHDLHSISAIRGSCLPEPEKGRHYTYQRDNKARSHASYCHGKARSITYSECVFVALGIRHAMYMLCGMSGPTVFVYVVSYTAGF